MSVVHHHFEFVFFIKKSIEGNKWRASRVCAYACWLARHHAHTPLTQRESARVGDRAGAFNFKRTQQHSSTAAQLRHFFCKTYSCCRSTFIFWRASPMPGTFVVINRDSLGFPVDSTAAATFESVVRFMRPTSRTCVLRVSIMVVRKTRTLLSQYLELVPR